MTTNAATEDTTASARPSAAALCAFGKLLVEVARLLRHPHRPFIYAATLVWVVVAKLRRLLGAAPIVELAPEPRRRTDRALISPPNQWAVP